MDLFHAIALAIIQGITEFLPISSSAHLVLPSQLFGWPDQGLAFDTAVHLGSLMAVITYFRHDLVRFLGAGCNQIFRGRATEDGGYAINLMIASLPILPIGFFARHVVENELRTMEVIAATTIIFALALWYADRVQHDKDRVLSARDALMIGIAQCLALIPGTSRSGITMTAALLLRYSRIEAARISMLIAIPTILGAAVSQLWDLVTDPAAADWFALAVGTSLSAVTAFTCIALLIRFIERIGYLPFVIYRLLLGGILILMIIS